MSTSQSPLAYKDCYDILERAINEPIGVRVQVEDMDKATYLRMRLHCARQINRNENRKTYEPGDPLYDRSVYDVVVIRLEPGNGCAWVKLTKVAVVIGSIEALTEEEFLPPPEPQRLLSAPLGALVDSTDEMPEPSLRRRLLP